MRRVDGFGARALSSALERLVAEGVQLQPFPDDVMTAAYDATQSLYAETAAGGGGYREIYDAYAGFQGKQTTGLASPSRPTLA